MAYKPPKEIARAGVVTGSTKAKLSWDKALVAGFLAGAYIAIAGLLASTVSAGMPADIWGTLPTFFTGAVFALGLILVIIAGSELLTGNMALVPLAAMRGRATLRKLAENWVFVLVGNLLGALFVAYFLAVQTGVGTADLVVERLGGIAHKKAARSAGGTRRYALRSTRARTARAHPRWGPEVSDPLPSARPRAFQRLRELPVVGRAADWGLGPRAVSRKTRRAGARIAGLKVTESVCPYCAVGCGQVVYTRDGELVDIEGNPRSRINQGTLCPKGSASRQLIQRLVCVPAWCRQRRVPRRRGPVFELEKLTEELWTATGRGPRPPNSGSAPAHRSPVPAPACVIWERRDFATTRTGPQGGGGLPRA